MYGFALTIHIIVCILLIGIVLLQAGKGAEMGAGFGSAQALFGGRGPASFLSKITVGAAIVFMVTSITLSFLTKEAAFETIIPETEVPADTKTDPESPASPESSTTQPAPQAPEANNDTADHK